MPRRILSGDFAGWLNDEMATRRMTARMLAARAGVDHTTIYRLSLGDRQPSLATAMAILRVLVSSPAQGPFFHSSREKAEALTSGAIDAVRTVNNEPTA